MFCIALKIHTFVIIEGCQKKAHCVENMIQTFYHIKIYNEFLISLFVKMKKIVPTFFQRVSFDNQQSNLRNRVKFVYYVYGKVSRIVLKYGAKTIFM